jgi:hypothetical protein
LRSAPVVTYGPPKSDPGPQPIWATTSPTRPGSTTSPTPRGFACITEDATHDFCPDGTSVGEPGTGDDIVARLSGGDDSFTATTSIGQFEVKGAGPGNDLILAADHDRDNRIDCGPGKHDVAVIDRIDPKPIHCEKVRVK